MKITIEATGTIETINGVNGVPARKWTGKTESGIEVVCWIPIIQVSRAADNSEFERELNEIKVERDLVSFDMRML